MNICKECKEKLKEQGLIVKVFSLKSGVKCDNCGEMPEEKKCFQAKIIDPADSVFS